MTKYFTPVTWMWISISLVQLALAFLFPDDWAWTIMVASFVVCNLFAYTEYRFNRSRIKLLESKLRQL